MILLLLAYPLIIAIISFISFLWKGENRVHFVLLKLAELGAFLVLPYMYITQSLENDCCDETTAFSPADQLTIWVIIGLCLVAYYLSGSDKKLLPPVVEVLVNTLLIGGIVFNIFLAIQVNDRELVLLGNLPVVLFAIIALAENQLKFIPVYQQGTLHPRNSVEKLAVKILGLTPMIKFPVLVILCLPLLCIISTLLLLFGQKPDAVIRAFTETYRHGFSQWDYKCDNVNCGGHYLCSVAANGHRKVVKPIRQGVRNGHAIICNRQLLISNAFEDLLQEKLPRTHKNIRQHYNKVGGFVHRYYNVFNNKFVSDMVYILMKPLEWTFLLLLYSFDRKPENRIAKQYLRKEDRAAIEGFFSSK